MKQRQDFDHVMAMREAQKVAAETLGMIGITGPRVDPVDACERIGIPVENDVDLPDEIAGRTIRRGNDVRIQLASGYSNPDMIRFTMAHEVGHICIPGHEKLFVRTGQHDCRTGFGSREVHERQADHFAAAFLMPADTCRKFLDAMPDNEAGLVAINQLRTTCEVSLTAAAIRYAELTSHVAMVIMSAGGHVQYCVRSEPFIEQMGDVYLQPDAKIPVRTPSATMVSQSILIERGERLDRGIDWSEWFPGHRGEAFEEAQGLGRYGKMLTVLTADDG